MFARLSRRPCAALLAAALAGVPLSGWQASFLASCRAEEPAAAPSADEQAIRDAAASFAGAYNEHDPAGIAAHFTVDGQLVDEAGNARRGYEAIQAVFAAVFEQYPDASMEIEVLSIRFLSNVVAEEEGIAYVSHDPENNPEENRYVATHLKQADGRWLLASARDLSPANKPSAAALEQLAWMIGEWVDESPEALVRTSYEWTDNRNYILGKFSVQVAGQPVRSFSQRIGWDPLDRVIRNWIFEDDGSFTTGVWTASGDHWIIKQTGVTSTGEAASATNTITRLGPDHFQWESHDRIIGGEVQLAPQPVIVVRRPPQPEE